MTDAADNPPDQGFTPNHLHHYVIKGSGLSCWAECDVIVAVIEPAPADRLVYKLACGWKLEGDNGPIVGSRAQIERAIGAAT
jgi:hypothetical protein